VFWKIEKFLWSCLEDGEKESEFNVFENFEICSDLAKVDNGDRGRKYGKAEVRLGESENVSAFVVFKGRFVFFGGLKSKERLRVVELQAGDFSPVFLFEQCEEVKYLKSFIYPWV